MNITVERINALIEDTGLTVRELAEYADCSKSAMQRYITGERDIPTSVINGLAKAFHVHPAFLFGWVNDKNYNLQEKPAEVGELSAKKKEFIQRVSEMSDAQLERLEKILALVESTD